MKILIFTSKDHCYANLLLLRVLQSGVLDEHTISICEQSSIIPKKGTIGGLLTYIRKAGLYYVFWQAMKEYAFLTARILADKESPYYQYWKLHHPNLTRRTLNNIHSPSAEEYIRSFAPDLILSLYSKEIIPERILNLASMGTVNLHPAPLPKYRGVSPTFWVLANQEEQTGITLHTIDTGIDTGAIVSQAMVDTKGHTTEHSLYMECTEKGANLLIAYLRNPANQDLKAQNEEGSYCSIPTKEAVKRFHKNGYAFFRFREFFS